MLDDSARRPRIRELRKDRGWTQQDVAEQLARLAGLRKEQRVGVTGDMVAKWERGDKGPSRLHRDLLSLLFGVPADHLGIGPAMPAKAQDDAAVSSSTMDG
jgi:transcriptional regulator with XRE-family HTH domain